jgi:hypothetical protein
MGFDNPPAKGQSDSRDSCNSDAGSAEQVEFVPLALWIWHDRSYRVSTLGGLALDQAGVNNPRNIALRSPGCTFTLAKK